MSEARETVQRMFAAFAEKNLDALLETVHPESRWSYTGANPEVSQAEFNGSRAVRKFFEGILRRLEMTSFTPREYIAQGDTVVVIGGEAGKIRSNGRRFRNEWIQKYVVRDGRITEMTEYNIEVSAMVSPAPRGMYRSMPGLTPAP